MSPADEPSQAYAPLKALLLGMAAERSLDRLLARITTTLADQPQVALARVWLLAPGDICPRCPRRSSCPQQIDCLQLIASAGTPLDRAADWSRIDGAFRRIPPGLGKVGRALSEPAGIADIHRDSSDILHPSWAQREQLRGFGAAPLRFGDDTLGVLAVFTRAPFAPPMHGWLRIIADHAATAIANARAFEEIERLRQALQLRNDYLREQIAEVTPSGELIGNSSALQEIMAAIDSVAPTDASVLITGPSGTGKELVARAVHRRSQRAEAPLIKVNCASVPHALFESEFFGHVRGAFTGALRDRAGRFQLADGGTLLLDEVGEIPLSMQSKLLRVLQDGEYERIGEERTRRADVRIVAATNRDLAQDVREGRFREDLYYRLNVFPIEVPPLCARRQDIALLARHFLALSARKLNRPARPLSTAQLQRLERYDWPGNVRELQNVIERALIRAPIGGALRFDVPDSGSTAGATMDGAAIDGAAIDGAAMDGTPNSDQSVLTAAQLKALERQNMARALAACGGKIHGPGGAAELLDMKPSTLRSRLKKLKLAE